MRGTHGISGITLALCTAMLLLCGCAADSADQAAASPAPTTADEPMRIVCMGDSITAGYGVYTDDEMYSAYLQELLGDSARVIAYGTPGETLLEASVYSSPPLRAEADTVLLQFGTNDASPSLFRADAFRASAETLLDTHIEALGAEHVAFLLPPCIYPAGGDIASFGMSTEKLARCARSSRRSAPKRASRSWICIPRLQTIRSGSSTACIRTRTATGRSHRRSTRLCLRI